ncbi:MAG: response regulator, partial [Methylophilaceae bacterium]
SMDLTESVFRLRNQLREMEIEAESQLQSRMAYLQETNETFDPLEFDRFTRLQELTRMMAESVNDVSTIQHGLLMNLDETESALQQQNRMNRELQHGLMNVRMVPFSMMSERLQRIVRQTSRELSKPVEMLIDGETVNIDRSVLDKIGAPLEHLLRNAVAHGMETPAERKKAKKAPIGNVTLKVRRENDEIVIIVTDDGAGINLEKVRKKAIQNGLFAENQEVSEQALMQVIFESGFSTATTVTQIAGRGVGLDSVRSDITALGGRIDVNNSVGHGAIFSIYLPVTLSVAQVVIVRAGGRIFALPSVMVEQVQKLKPAVIAEGYAANSITWGNHRYPLHALSKLTGDFDHAPEAQLYSPLLLLRSGTYQIALHVDEIIGNQEVVMKPIGPQLARVPGMMGATVMGDGNIMLILNAVQLANREDLAVGTIKVSNAPIAPAAEVEMPMVLVVDDSLTMRKVLGRLLEREGYRVMVAKDGMDALQVLQDISPDIILTDIEMPRMDGFELVRNIRGDVRTTETPLVMISSRTAEKHRNLAQELGVNVFLGKPVQDEELLTQISLLLGRAAPIPLAHS